MLLKFIDHLKGFEQLNKKNSLLSTSLCVNGGLNNIKTFFIGQNLCMGLASFQSPIEPINLLRHIFFVISKDQYLNLYGPDKELVASFASIITTTSGLFPLFLFLFTEDTWPPTFDWSFYFLQSNFHQAHNVWQFPATVHKETSRWFAADNENLLHRETTSPSTLGQSETRDGRVETLRQRVSHLHG